MHPHRPLVLHMDFQRIKATEKLHMKIPLHFDGADEAPGVKVDGGILAHAITELDITCLPKDLPEYIAVDVSELGMNESIHLSDITLPEGVELTVTAYHEGESQPLQRLPAPKAVGEESASLKPVMRAVSRQKAPSKRLPLTPKRIRASSAGSFFWAECRVV